MELKILCDCGQKYAFDVEPVAGQMPFTINCPSCGMDGTETANALLIQTPVSSSLLKVASSIRLQVATPAHEPPAFSAPPPPMRPPLSPVHGPAPRQWEKADMTERHSLALGVLGAIIGAVLGVGVMLGFQAITGFCMPIIGLAIGLLSGFGARLLYKGTDVPLGAAAAVVTLFAAGVTFLFMFGLGAILSVMVLLVITAVAYKIAG